MSNRGKTLHVFEADINELSECQHCGWPKAHRNHYDPDVDVRCGNHLCNALLSAGEPHAEFCLAGAVEKQENKS